MERHSTPHFKKIFRALLLCIALLVTAKVSVATTLINAANNGNFENATPGLNWNIVNPGGGSLWFTSTFAKCNGTNAAYIGTAVGNNNYNNGAARVAHIYRDITFPACETSITLNFNWKGQGESTYDYLMVYLVPTSTTPLANTQLPAGNAISGILNLQAGCTASSLTITGAQAGNASGASTMRLVFSWRCDGSLGTNPAAMFDDVVLTSNLPAVAPNCANISSPTNGASGMCPGGVTLNWTAGAAPAPDSYLLYFGTDVGATNIVNGTNIGSVLTYNPGTLSSSTTYYWRIVPTNCAGNASGCAIWSFTTGIGPVNDDPCSAISLTPAASCSYATYSNYCASATTAGSPPAPGCASYNGGDVWFTVTVPAGGSLTFDTQTGVILDGGMAIYSGTCGALTLVACDDDSSPNGAMSYISVSGQTPGASLFIRVWEYGGDNNGTFGICVVDPCAGGLPSNDNCSGAIALTMNAYGSCASTSAGNVTCATASGTSIGACFGTPDDDIWYSFVATATAHPVTLTTASGFDAYMQLYSGSCGTLTSMQCSDPNTFTASGLTVGLTYYIRVSSYGSGAPTNGNITLCISAPAACPADMGAGNVSIASLPYNGTGLTTCAAGNDITATNASSCGSTNYFVDADKVFTFTPSSSGSITATLNSIQSWTGMTLYDGCPFTANCVAYVQNSSSGAKSFCTSVVAGTTYYLVVDGWGTAGSCITTFSLDITAPSAGIPNDLPCSATALTLGTSGTGDNTCTSAGSEPAVPSCWTSGSANTVWYSFVAPASGIAYVQTTMGTLNSSQIGLYSGACGSLSLVSCNQYPAAGCSAATSNSSILNATGLTSGATYYVRVDGRNDYVGTFTIIVDNGTSGSSAPVPGQDCMSPLVVCNSVMTIGNPGYSNTGNVCDFTGSGNCTSGELNSVWYQINIGGTGNFNFSLMPNDGSNGSCGTETDYDYLLWRVSGTGATTNCATISSASGTALLACNFSALGVTGIAAGGNAPAPINNCFNGAFEPTVSVTAGDVLYLVIQNYSGSTQGFVLDMTTSGAGVVNYTAPSTVYWTGGASSSWINPTNWGSCGTYPVCGVSAVVTAASATQPVITGTEYVNNLTINPGSTLTLGAGAVLHVCGSFTNYGTFTASPTSTVIFDNAAVAQSISGGLTGSNKFGHLTVTKTGSAVTLNNDIDVGGNFTTSNSTSIFNSNNFYVRVAGNFSNATGNTTYTNTGTLGVLEFNGTAAQTYNQGSSALDLNIVLMNHTSTGVTLNSNMNIKTTTGTLTLTLGKIITGAFEVTVANTASAAVSTGNVNSFVQGNLRRSILSTGAYDFPVGHAAKGYQRANINFTSATSIGNLRARFDPWGVTPVVQGGSECSTTYNLNSEDNGWWTIDANASPGTGIYTATLYPLNATNTAAAGGWTVIKTPTVETGTWSLVGSCVSSSTATWVQRTGMSGFSLFSTGQAVGPLPIELLFFNGHNQGVKNKLIWSTASETNNDHFALERSEDGNDFEQFATIGGAGNSSQVNNYTAFDNSPFNGITYYRLKQVDYNGEYTYSTIIALKNKLDEISISNVHPNPTTDDVNFDFFTPVKGTIRLYVLDYTGRIVVNEFQNVEEGRTDLNARMNSLAKGVYTLKIEFSEGNFMHVTKVIKQ